MLERAGSILELLEKNAGAPKDAIAAIPTRAVRNRRKGGSSDPAEDSDLIQLELL